MRETFTSKKTIREKAFLTSVHLSLRLEIREAFDKKYKVGNRRSIGQFMIDWTNQLGTEPPSKPAITNFLNKERDTEHWLIDGLCQLLLSRPFSALQQQYKSLENSQEVETRSEILLEETNISEISDTETSNKVFEPVENTSDIWLQEMWDAASNEQDIKRLEESFKELEILETDVIKKLNNKITYQALRYRCGDTSAISELQNMANQPAVSYYALFWIGKCYEESSNFEEAAEAFENYALDSQTEVGRTNGAILAAHCLFKTGKCQEAFARVMHELGKVTNPDAVFNLYEGLASLYELAEEPELQALALEKALESRPNEPKLRFDVAYSYGAKNLDVLSLLHYKTLLNRNPDNATALNNIGVQYKRLQMQIGSVNCYKKAVELHETLAAANLASIYMDAGFIEEASLILDEAQQQKDVHPNVWMVRAKLSEIKKEEVEIEERYLKSAKEQQNFLRLFAEAYFTEKLNSLNSFSGLWRLPNGKEIIITETEDKIAAKYNPDNQNEQKYFTGSASNQAARLTFPSSSSYSSDSKPGYAYLSPDGQKIRIMILKKTKHDIFTLVREKVVRAYS